MDIGYLAGIIDGERCIFIQKFKYLAGLYNYCLSIDVQMQCKEIIYGI